MSYVLYQDMYVNASDEVGDGKWCFEVFSLGSVKVFNGKEKFAKRLYVEDTITRQVIFELKDDASKASSFAPKFFKANDDLPILVVVDLRTSYSWGQYIFILVGAKVYYSGFLTYSVDNFNFSNMALYANVEYIDDYFILSFGEDSKFIDYTKAELIKSDLMFKMEKGNIARI